MIDWEAFYGALRQPDFVPGFEIQNHLGGGAFGEVYKARKTSIGKAYAIKFLKVDGEEADGVERELDSVRLFAAIDHPNLVTIEDMGVAGGVPYLVMGYAGEDTLARRIRRGELEQEAALGMFVQAARGVLALHDRRLAHFDLKPGNVFLNGDTARVGDYGLAKLLTEGRQTLSFGRGTPLYMAPEMLRNRADHRADVYSLGVILFESLTGSLPYASDSGLGVVVRETDEAPEYPEDFPARLIPVVSRCLRLDPEDRYDSVRELLEDMQQSVERGEEVALAPLAAGPTPPPLPGDFDGSRPEGQGPREDTGQIQRLAGAEPASPTSELRRAARELARGAREVAQGALDGVRGTAQESPSTSAARPGAPLRDGPPPSAGGGASVAGASVTGAGAASEGAAPAFGDVVEVATLADEDPAPPPAPATPVAAAAGPPGAEQSSLRAEALGTIPVPPRSAAGPFGTILEAFVLGAEMLGALVGWPARVGSKLLVRTADAAATRAPGLAGRALRVLVFCVGFFLLGGLCALLLLAVFALVAA